MYECMSGGRRQSMLDVTVVLLDDGHASTAIMPVEVFAAAGTLWHDLHDRPAQPECRVRTVSITGGPVRSPYGLGIVPQGSIEEVRHTDVVLVASSGLELDLSLIRNSALLPWLRGHYEQGAYVAGACVGAAYLAEAGLLDGRFATSHWALCDKLARRYPGVKWRPDLFITEDSRLLCSGGVYAAIDVSLYLVEKLCGHDIALECSKALLLPMPRLSQLAYAVAPVGKSHGDDRIRSVEAFMQANLREVISTQRLADRVGMTVRTFGRRFKAATGRMPADYLRALRIAAAKSILEQEARPIQAVSQAVGYDDVAFFRELFKRETGMTPAGYRAQFAPMQVRERAVLQGA